LALNYYPCLTIVLFRLLLRRSAIVYSKPIKFLLCNILLAMTACGERAPVLTGIDILERDNFEALAGQRVALLTNQTGIDRDGTSTIRLLHDANNVNLVQIFSPEHGPNGELDVPVIGDDIEAYSNVRIISLYGSARRPTPEMLEDIDTIVFDIQDIGTRFYTYISTMGGAMQSAAENGVRFVVLDRPNPINGVTVSGPVLDDGKQSFVGYHLIPIRHGMTVGEIAMLFKSELAIDIDLQVIKLEGWRRSDLFDDTGLPWINPSPNMRSLTEALLYPGIGLLEKTNLSVGRGTDTPFEVIGAPWLEGATLAAQLTDASLPGVSFEAIEFTPDASKFTDEACSGVRLIITNRTQFDPLQIGFEIARQLALNYADTWDVDAYLFLLGNDQTMQAVRKGLPYADILASYEAGLNDFRQRREHYLLYP
jgi:uncharacterized protein YbbC (DUF1343 family)